MKIFEDVESRYSEFQQKIATVWASSHFTVWLQENPGSPYAKQRAAFEEFLEIGLDVANEICQPGT